MDQSGYVWWKDFVVYTYIMITSVQNVIKEAKIQIFFVCCFVTIVSIVFTGDEVDYLVVSGGPTHHRCARYFIL